MKAIIMAGGEGKRLKAVSGDTPKPLVSLCGRPVMEHIVLLLKRAGITDICAALKYRAEDIKAHFGDGSALGVRMRYYVENEPLGTAGGVRNCRDFYGDEDVLVISGDAACDFDLTELIKAHEENSSAVTMALYSCSEPLRYGLALCGRDGCVHSFIEKPDWTRVVTDLVNTGIYILSPRAMDMIPEGVSFDFAKDLFPLLLKKAEKILGKLMTGYWCDIGTPKSYYECCIDAIEGRLKLDMSGGFEVQTSEIDNPREEDESELLLCPDRARAMAGLSGLFLDMGADFSEGINLHGSDFDMCIRPDAVNAALRLRVNASDAELARELSLSTASLIKRINGRLEKVTGV